MKLLENRESSGRSRNFFTKFKLGKERVVKAGRNF